MAEEQAGQGPASQHEPHAPGRKRRGRLPVLTLRQGLVVLAVGVVVGLLAAATQLVLEWRNMQHDIPRDVQRVLNLIDPSATRALFQLSPNLGQGVMDSLESRYPAVQAKLYDELGQVFVKTGGKQQKPGWLAQRLFGNITHYEHPVSSAEVPELGRLVVDLSAVRLTDTFVDRAERIFWTNMARTLAISALLMLVFHWIVTSALLRLARGVEAVDTSAPARALLPVPRGHRGDEIGRLAGTLNALLKASQTYLDARERAQSELEAANRELEDRVAARTRELEQLAEQLRTEKNETERVNARMEESLSYAEAIQRAVLPRLAPGELGLRAVASWWLPRDQVGGDIYYAQRSGDRVLLALMDCTGHGVPGALISFAALTALDRVVAQATSWAPAALLRELDGVMRQRLHGTVENPEQDDGLEAGLACIDLGTGAVDFAGVGLNLFVSGENAPVTWATGARGGIGYRFIAPFPREIKETRFEAAPETMFCMASDGILEQISAAKRRQLGRRQFARLVQNTVSEGDLAHRLEALKTAFAEWQGDEPQRDDISLIAFQPR